MKIRSAAFDLLILPLLFAVGLLLSPPIFHGLVWTGRMFEPFSGLRNVSFEDVVSRVVAIHGILGFLILYRRAKRGRIALPGWAPTEGWRGSALMSVGLGMAVPCGLYLIGMGFGVYVWEPESLGVIAGRILIYVPAAFLIAFIEETLFRGLLFGQFRQSISFIAAAALSSVLYSLVHFASPVSPVGIVHPTWNTGLMLIPHTFAVPGGWTHVIPFSLTLFVLGLAFCRLTAASGALYRAAGLHAGVVLGLKLPSFFLESVPSSSLSSSFFAGGDSLDKSWAACVGSLALYLIVHRFPGCEPSGGRGV